MRTVVGGSIDGTGRTHLVMEATWRTACGSRLPQRWLPQFGAEVTCKRCCRTVAHTFWQDARARGAGPIEQRQVEEQVEFDASRYVDVELLARRARQVRRESQQRRAERRHLSERAQQLRHVGPRSRAAQD